ncbi:hypothetical protein U0070_015274 [Myodes glareolus]|uniref:Uncharacterized protein n=1 Tax=Myodes glareolus TaxID=447135 RepID=A0AAW0JYP6_MYOGA
MQSADMICKLEKFLAEKDEGRRGENYKKKEVKDKGPQQHSDTKLQTTMMSSVQGTISLL